MRSILVAALCHVLLLASARGQEAKPRSAPSDLSLTAVGRQHHPIHTSSREAQDYFDQGLTLIYGFNHEEAVRAFQRAAELDPASPMPLWGIANAVGPNYNLDVDPEREKLAYETIQQALKLAQNAPQIERDYVSALAARYSGDAHPDYKKLSRDYAGAMRELSHKYPDDLDAATLYAESLMNLNPWKLWTHDGKPGENTEEIVRTLESVLARDPLHAGANHYYIHAVEASPDPSRALPSALRLESLVPQAGHLVHMPAHIYVRTGDYEAAAKRNEVAAAVDRAYAEKAAQQGSLYDLMYHSHNEHFLAFAASMNGQYAVAKAAADKLAARLAPHTHMMPMLDFFMVTPIWVDARFGKWDAILARTEPAKERQGLHIYWRYARTLALTAKRDVSAATAEYAEFKAEAATIPADLRLGDQNQARGVLEVASHVLQARLAAAGGESEEAIAYWREAVAAQDALNYAEPPDWYLPVRESLGAALLNAGKVEEAEAVFRADLRQHPRSPRSLFGLLQVLKAQGRDSDAAWVQRQLDEAWKNADTKLELKDL
jgi:tetratricopeptide (TPR) repeat protein